MNYRNANDMVLRGCLKLLLQTTWYSIIALAFAFTSIGAPCLAQKVASPVTSTDEVPFSAESRIIVGGSGTTVNLQTNGKISVDSSPMYRKTAYWIPLSPSSESLSGVNINAPDAYGSSGTHTANPTSDGMFVNYETSGSLGKGGIRSDDYLDAAYQFKPVFTCRIRTSSDISDQRIWIGLAADELAESSAPTENCAAFRFDTGASDSAWKCYTNPGSGAGTVISSNVTVSANTTYNMRIDMTNAAKILFYINGSLVATSTSTLPGATVDLGPVLTITALDNDRQLNVGPMRLESN